MDEYTLHAWEVLGLWSISLKQRYVGDDGKVRWKLLYTGTHVLIDEEDPQIRAELLMHQVYTDLERANRGELDILAERPAHH